MFVTKDLHNIVILSICQEVVINLMYLYLVLG